MTAEPYRACPCRAVSSPVDLQVLSEAALDIFMPKEGQSLKHVSLLSRHLNGEGMGFFPKAAKVRPHAHKLTHAHACSRGRGHRLPQVLVAATPMEQEAAAPVPPNLTPVRRSPPTPRSGLAPLR